MAAVPCDHSTSHNTISSAESHIASDWENPPSLVPHTNWEAYSKQAQESNPTVHDFHLIDKEPGNCTGQTMVANTTEDQHFCELVGIGTIISLEA